MGEKVSRKIKSTKMATCETSLLQKLLKNQHYGVISWVNYCKAGIMCNCYFCCYYYYTTIILVQADLQAGLKSDNRFPMLPHFT